MTDFLSVASTAIDLVKRLRDINKNVANAEFASALADLSMELSELKIQAAGLLEENDRLKRELRTKEMPSLKYKGFAYFDSSEDGPFCPGCYDNHQKAVRLTALPKTFQRLASHTCPVCSGTFGGK